MQAEWTCGSCGLVIRRERLRCPRCNELLDERPPAAAGEAPPAADAVVDGRQDERARWAAIAAVMLLAGGVAAWTLTARDDEPSATAPTPAPDQGRAERAARGGSADDGRADYRAVAAVQRGAAAYARGDVAGALAAYEAALAADPDDAEARNNLAQMLVRLGRAADALPHFDRVIDAHPERWAYRFNRGRAYATLERWPEAIADYEAAAAGFPDDYATFYNLGLAHARMNAHAPAAQAFERAVTLAPGESSFLISLGTEYIALDRLAEARTVFEQYLREQPEGAESGHVKQVLDGLTTYTAARR
jgi:tetratricopeptide (TPR) repeat protein